MPNCIIPACFGEITHSVFIVPKNIERRAQWSKAILDVFPTLDVSKNYFVCEKHFLKTDFTSYTDINGKVFEEVVVKRKRLKQGAVPHFDVLNLDSDNDSTNSLMMEQAKPRVSNPVIEMACHSCSYHQCGNTSQEQSMFGFPTTDKNRLRVWIKNSGNAALTKLPKYKLKDKVICAVHFCPTSIQQTDDKISLIGHAVPVPYNQESKLLDDGHLDTCNCIRVLKVASTLKVYGNRKRTFQEMQGPSFVSYGNQTSNQILDPLNLDKDIKKECTVTECMSDNEYNNVRAPEADLVEPVNVKEEPGVEFEGDFLKIEGIVHQNSSDPSSAQCSSMGDCSNNDGAPENRLKPDTMKDGPVKVEIDLFEVEEMAQRIVKEVGVNSQRMSTNVIPTILNEELVVKEEPDIIFEDEAVGNEEATPLQDVEMSLNTTDQSVDPDRNVAKKLLCEVCGEYNNGNQALEEHMSILRIEENSYSCNKCDAVFVKKNDMTKHIRLNHSGDKPYACNTCGTTSSHSEVVAEREKEKVEKRSPSRRIRARLLQKTSLPTTPAPIPEDSATSEPHTSDVDDTLHHIRVERKITQRLISSLPADAQRLLITLKREAQLERMLMPDAPPRKRPTRIMSPDRQPCIMEDPTIRLSFERSKAKPVEPSTSGKNCPIERSPAKPVEPSTSGKNFPIEHSSVEFVEPSTSSTDCPIEKSSVEFAEPSTSSTDCPIEKSSVEFAEPSTSSTDCPIEHSPEDPTFSVPVEDCADYLEIVAEVVIDSSTTSMPGASDNGNQYADITEGLTNVVNDNDENDELNIDDNACLPTVGRNASSEPACLDDLTPYQAVLLQAEDDANDWALREMAPENSYIFNWSKDRLTFLGQREVFTETSGPTFEVTDKTEPVDIFYKMFDVDFIDLLCRETNRYASQKIASLQARNKLSSHAWVTRWNPTDRDEMISFLAIQILQGLYPLPEEEAYFAYNGFGTMPYFAKAMSYNRFILLKTMLHFVDSQTLQDTTKLREIRPIIDYFNEKFSGLYMPSQNIAIDESLLKWSGRLSFSQKISTKTAKVGVKTYELCESSTGYLWKIFVYAGKDRPTATTDDQMIDGRDVDEANDRPDGRISSPDEDQRVDRPDVDEGDDRPDGRIPSPDENQIVDRPDVNEANDSLEDGRHNDVTAYRPDGLWTDEFDTLTTDRLWTDEFDRLTTYRQSTGGSNDRPATATAKIVYELIEPLLYRGHTLIMDNFYNSPLLLRCLKKQKTDCFGTLRLNREFVPDSVKTLKKTELRQGEVVATYCSDLSVLVWRDANLVSLISTYHNLEVGTSDKYNRITYKPSIVLDYNKSMGGVDRKDQFLSAHPIERLRNRVWYKKLFRRLYNTAIFNCYVIFSSVHQKISHRKFRTVLAEELLKRHRLIDLTTEPRLNVRSSTSGQVKGTVMKKKIRHRTQARPIVDHNHFPIHTGSKYTCCRLCVKKTRTVWKCEECDVNLCIEGCFRAYHKP